jgi:hypothetical protein
LAILEEAENVDVNEVCAKYEISAQTYRVWRYKASGIKPRKHFSPEKKRKIFKEGARNIPDVRRLQD